MFILYAAALCLHQAAIPAFCCIRSWLPKMRNSKRNMTLTSRGRTCSLHVLLQQHCHATHLWHACIMSFIYVKAALAAQNQQSPWCKETWNVSRPKTGCIFSSGVIIIPASPSEYALILSRYCHKRQTSSCTGRDSALISSKDFSPGVKEKTSCRKSRNDWSQAW